MQRYVIMRRVVFLLAVLILAAALLFGLVRSHDAPGPQAAWQVRVASG